jgi:hypothetical protein
MFRVIAVTTLSLIIAGCSPGPHSIISSSTNGLIVAYDAYATTPTLTSKAQVMAQQYCETHLRDAHYVGARVPNPWETMEWHDFQCVERPINTSAILTDVDNAILSTSSSTYRELYLECIRENIVALDDLKSDALTIALAISGVCSRQHFAYVTDIVSQLNYSSEIKNGIRDSFIEAAETKILPYVLNWRKIVEAGFNQKAKPSPKELPNDLYQASVEISL